MTTRFKTIGLMGRASDPQVAQVVGQLAAFLSQSGVTALVDESLGVSSTGQALPRTELAAKADLMIVVGGDGTLLKATQTIAARPLPLVGVNLGRLGFLADITPERVQDDIAAILKGEFSREERLLLESSIQRAGGTESGCTALNDVVVQKADGGR